MEKELLLKYIQGDCTENEKIAITKWLDSDPEHMKEFFALRKLYDITIWQLPISFNAGQKESRNIRFRKWKNVYVEAAKIAAVLVLAFFVSYFLIYKSQHEETIPPVVMQTLHVPAGQRAEITLEDGSKVWLNAQSTLVFPNHFSNKKREVQMDGEGYFEVTSNKEKPFIVKTTSFDVKVLGTTFNLMAYSGSDYFETALFEGAVEVSKPNGTNNVILHPNERIYLENNKLFIAPIVHMDHFLWKDGIISFDDEPFLEMVKKLELYFDLKIIVKNDNIQKYRCTGKFRTKDGVEHILKVLQLSNRFSYTIDEKLNIITIK